MKHSSFILSLFSGLLISISPVNAQMLHDSLAVKKIKTGVDFMYNLEFDKAIKIYSEVEKLYPGHPVNFLLKGIYSYWKNYPMLSTSHDWESFENDLRKCIDLSSEKPYSEKYEAESLLTNVCARGMNPAYKPIASLFPPGDMVKGLTELVKAAELSIFLKAESYSLLTYIYTGFENDFIKALLYSRTIL